MYVTSISKVREYESSIHGRESEVTAKQAMPSSFHQMKNINSKT